MYKAFGYRTQMSFTMCYIYHTLKSVDISGVPKRGTDQQQNRKTCQTPAIPHPERSPGQPRPRDRELPNWAKHTSLSAALMHQPTPPTRTAPTPKPKPAKAPARTREPRFKKVPHSATDLTPADLSRDTRHIKVPHN